jgi:hypothetical protein
LKFVFLSYDLFLHIIFLYIHGHRRGRVETFFDVVSLAIEKERDAIRGSDSTAGERSKVVYQTAGGGSAIGHDWDS